MRALERRLESGSIRLAPLSLWIALFLAVAAPVAAQQPLETWGFEGQILSVSDINDLLFTPLPEVGSTISGVFSFDPSLPDGNADPTVGQYDNAVRCVNVFVGDNEILLSPPGPVFGVGNFVVSDGVIDSVSFELTNVPALVNGQAVGSGGFVETLQSVGNGAVQGTDIPDLPPAPGDFPAKSLVVQLKRNASDLLATAITAAPTELFTTEQICVPEPGSYPAGLAGIAGLAALRRARRRSSAP